MKKLFRFVPMLLISALLLCTPVYASEQAELPEQSVEQEVEKEEQQKPITNVELEIFSGSRYVALGESPDFSKSNVVVTYDDGSTEKLPVDEQYIGEWDKTKSGRQSLKITAFDKEFTEYFIVYDKSKSAAKFTDVNNEHWAYTAITRCVQSGFLVGNADGSFGITANMTRAQFCQMMYQVYKNDPTVFTYNKDASFTDVNETEWYYEAVTACAKSNIVNGMGDGTFNPNANITRQDVAVIMMRILLGVDNVDDIDVDSALKTAREELKILASDFDAAADYAKKYVAAALGKIYFGDQDGNVTPKKDITRAECAAMMSNYYFADFGKVAKKPLVYLSPSNQMSNAYANYDSKLYPDYTEGKVMTLVAEKMVPILESMGYDVHIADKDLTIKGAENYKRADEAYDMNADCYVAIHSNGISGNDGSKQGAACFYNGNNEGAKELSDYIYSRMSALTPTTDKLGSKNDMLTSNPYAEVRYPKMANVIVEVEFHDHKPYADWIVSNVDEIAKAISQGIDDYLKFKYTAA